MFVFLFLVWFFCFIILLVIQFSYQLGRKVQLYCQKMYMRNMGLYLVLSWQVRRLFIFWGMVLLYCFFNCKNEDLNVEDVFSCLIISLFGKGVACGVFNSVFLEQKKMLKSSFYIVFCWQYIFIIEKEIKEYFQSWGEKDLFEGFFEFVILIVSYWLYGQEVRSRFYEKVAQFQVGLI